MTKIKLAKEWVEKEYDELKYEKCQRKDFVFTFYELKEMGKQAFLAGYNKANEWYKVADGDIPKNERWVCNQDGCYCYYDIDTEQWLDTEGTRTRTIEWCDMPKFKE